MPKRGAISAFLTAIGVVLLINFKTPSQQGLAATSQQTVTATQSNGASSSASASAQPTASPTGTAAASTTQTITGAAISYFYGTAQVQVTLVNGKITDVTALQLPTDGRSGRISQQVEPILRSEVVSAQSAQINLVSGATYTSDAYAQSLQAALDQAHA